MQIEQNNQPADDATEFERLFNEDEQANSILETKPDGEQDQQDDEPPAQPQEQASSDEQGGDAAPGDGGEAAVGEPPTEQPGAVTTSETGEPADWLTTLPDEVRERINLEREEAAKARKALEDRYNALHGRLAPVQQALSDAQRRLQEQQRQAATPAVPTPEAQDSFFDSEVWKQWSEDFPGDAKVFREGLEAQRKQQDQAYRQLEQQVSQLAERLAQTEQVATQTTRETEEQKLDAAHADWRELNNSDEFWEWFDGYRAAQPKVMQRNLYYNDDALKDAFGDSSFVISMLDQFKAARPAQESAPAVPESTQTPEPPVPPPANNARLNMSRAPDVRGNTPVPRSVPLESLTPEEQFAHIWSQTE